MTRQLMGLLFALSVASVLGGCGRGGGGGRPAAPGPGPAAKNPSRPPFDPVAATKSQLMFDQRTLGGELEKACQECSWQKVGNQEVEFRGKLKPHGEELIVRWEVIRTPRLRKCTLHGEDLHASSFQALIFPDQNRASFKPFQGTWLVVDREVDGQSVKREGKLGGVAIVVGGGEWIIRQGDELLRLNMSIKGNGWPNQKIDEKSPPIHIDFRRKGAPQEEQPILGIFSLNGDDLRMCNAPSGKDRPTELKTAPGSGNTLLVLKRETTGIPRMAAVLKP